MPKKLFFLNRLSEPERGGGGGGGSVPPPPRRAGGGGGELRQFVRQLYSGPMCTYLYAMLLEM
jgi:hypothetical protein